MLCSYQSRNIRVRSHSLVCYPKRSEAKDGLVVNTTVTVGGGRMYFVETHSPKALADKLGRNKLLNGKMKAE